MTRHRAVGRVGSRGRLGRALLAVVLVIPLLQASATPAAADATPVLTVETTSYAAPEPAAGVPVSYTSTVAVLQDSGGVTLVHTMPAGVTPLGGYGAEWACQQPSGQSITCNTIAAVFTADTTLPTVTFSGIVTIAGITASTIQTSSATTASSGNASATDASMTAGTLPTAPTGVSASASSGPVVGGGPLTVTADSDVPPTILLIGTTAEFAAGTPEVLLPCPAGPAAGCFDPQDGGSSIESMPARAAPAAVDVMVVTLGVGASTGYSYDAIPTPGTDDPTHAATPTEMAPLSVQSLGVGEEGVRYRVSLPLPLGSSPLSWAVSGGTQPPGLHLSTSNGVLSGIPSTAGDYSFTVLTTGFDGEQETNEFGVAIAGRPVVTIDVADGQQGVAYSAQATIVGGIAPFDWSMVAGSLPAGLSVDDVSGLISGTPTVSGTFSATVAAVDALGQRGTATFGLVIIPAPMLTFGTPPSGRVAVVYSATLTATGTGPLAWSISDGDLPAGLTLATATGLLSGTPTLTGSSSFTVTVTDANGRTADKAVTLVVRPGTLVISQSADKAADALTIQGQTVTYTVLARNTGAADLAGIKVIDAMQGIVDDATYNGDGAATYIGGAVGTVTSSAPAGVLTWIGDLPAGSSVRITFSVTVSSSEFVDQVLRSWVGSDAPSSTCPPGGDDPRCFSNLNVASNSLSIAATTDVSSTISPGNVARFRIEVSGPYAYPGAEFSIDLAGMTDDAAYNNDGTATIGNVTATSSSLSWTGDLAGGETAVITYSVTVPQAPAGDYALTATVESASANSNCPAGDPAEACRVTVPILRTSYVLTNQVGRSPEMFGHWTFDEGDGSTAADSGPPPSDSDPEHPATLFGGAGWTAGTQGEAALGLNGTDGYAEMSAGTLDTTESFSVSAWVKLTTLAGNQTAVSQDGSTSSVFSLGLRNDGHFGFQRLPGDADGLTGAATASATGEPVVNRWYRLLGIYDQTSSTVSLYVDGQLQQTVAAPQSTPTTGQLLVGRGEIDHQPADFFDGAVDDVQIYRGALTGGSPATAGTNQDITTTISNSGQTVERVTAEIDLRGALDDATYDGSNATAQYLGGVPTAAAIFAYNPSTRILTWSGYVSTGDVVIIRATVSVNAPVTGDRMLSTLVTSGTTGSSCSFSMPFGAGSSCRASGAVLIPELTITQTANVSTATPGSVVQYTVTVRNSGQTPYQEATFDESLAGILHRASYKDDVFATSGTATVDHATIAGSNLNWTGDLPAGASATITYSVTVTVDGFGFTDPRILSGVVISPTLASNCASESTDPRCTSSVAVLDPELSLSASTDVDSTTPGSRVQYTVTAANTGDIAYTGAIVTVDLAGVLDDASYRSGSSSTGTIKRVGALTTWKLTLPVGATATATLDFVVTDPDDGDGTVTATVASDDAGSTCPAGTTDPPCSASVPVLLPELTIEKTANAATVAAGGTVKYTITITNTGATRFPAANFVDHFGGAMDDAMYYGDAAATSGNLMPIGGALTWNGNLAVGSSATITYSMIVNNPDTGDHVLTSVVRSNADSNCRYGSTDTRCTSAVSVVDSDLTIEQGAEVERNTVWVPAQTTVVVAGDYVQFTTAVTNAGSHDVTGASFNWVLTGIFDDANFMSGVLSNTGDLRYDVNELISWSGDLAPGATATITFIVQVHNGGGDNLLTSTAISPTVASNCPESGDDNRCRVTVPVARLTIAEAAGATLTAEGSLRQITTFTNNGQVPYSDITITADTTGLRDDLLPTPGLTTRSGIVTETATNETWTGNIPVGGVITLYSNYTAIAPAAGDRWISRTWTSEAPGNNCWIDSQQPDPACTMEATLPVLRVSQVANTTDAAPGDTVDYTVTVRNDGWIAFTGISVSVELAGLLDDATPANASADVGEVGWGDENLTWTGDLAAGDVATVNYSVTVADPDHGDKALTSRLQSSAPGSNCPPSTTDPSCWLAVSVLTPLLLIESSADRNTVFPGDAVNYSVSISNAGLLTSDAEVSVPLNGLTDDADIALHGPDVGDSVITDGVLHWVGTLSPGDSATFTYTATVNHVDDQLMSATATSTSAGSNCADGSTDTRCTATATVVGAYLFTFTATADTATAVSGGTVNFTVTAASTYEQRITTNFAMSLTDILDDAIIDGDPVASSGVPAIVSDQLTWTGQIPANGSVSVSFSVTVNQELANGILAGTVTSDEVSGHDCHPWGTDPRCSVAVPIAGLHIVQVASDVVAPQGSTITLTTTLTNTGGFPYQGIPVALSGADGDDTIPTGNQTASAGIFARLGASVVWIGDVPVGGTVILTRSVLVRDPPIGDRLLTAVVSSNAFANNCPAEAIDPDCTLSLDVVPVVVAPGVTVSLSADTQTLTPGGTASFTMTVINQSIDTDYVSVPVSADLSGLLDDAVYNGDASATSGSVQWDGPALNWSGELEMGAIVVITYTVTALDPADGDLALIGTVSSSGPGSNCPPGENRSSCMAVVVVQIPELTITTAADAPTTIPGATVTYTVTAVNSGQTDYTAIDVRANLTGLLDDATYNSGATATTGGVPFYTYPTLTWFGDLAVGAEVTITFTAAVDDPDAGDHLATQTVSSGAPGNNCPPEGTDPRCTTSVGIAGLTIVNSADVSTAKPTDVIDYTAMFTNSGQAPYREISITVDLTGAVDDATYNGYATVTSGGIRVDPGGLSLTWTGNIAPGQTVTLTTSVTVNNPDTGDGFVGTVISTEAVGSNCPLGGTEPQCATSVTGVTPELTINTAADTSSTTPGSTIVYTVIIKNMGPTDYDNAIVTDDLNGLLDEADYGMDDEATNGQLGYSDGVLTWFGSLEVGAAAVVTFSIRLHEPYIGDLTLVNRVVSDEAGSNCPSDSADPDCSSTVTVLIPELTISITTDPAVAAPGSAVGYTVVISNTGETPYLGATVFTYLDRATNLAAYNNDASTDVGTVEYNDREGLWTGDLETGATATVTFSLIVDTPIDGGGALVASVVSAAAGSTCTSNDPCLTAVPILPTPSGLTVSATAATATAIPGDEVLVTITITNTGGQSFSDTTVTTQLNNTLDDATLTGYLVASSGRVGFSTPNLTWTGDIPVDGVVTITYAALVNDPPSGDRELAATVVAAGSNCELGSTDPACRVLVGVMEPGLTIAATADVAITTPGAVVRQAVTLTNSGQNPYTAITVTTSLQAVLTNATYDADAAVTSGNIDYTEPELTWSGDLPVGGSVTITYSVTVDDPDTGDKNMITTVRSAAIGSNCPPGTQNPECDLAIRVLLPVLTISQDVDPSAVVAGSVATFTITAVNTGPADYVPAAISEDLTAILDDGGLVGPPTATTGTATFEDDNLNWTGDLAAGAGVVITFSVTASFPAPGDHLMAGTAVSASPGSNCSVDSADPSCAAEVTVLIPELTIVKRVDRTEVVLGGTARYTISATNTGAADYTSADLSDSLGGVLDDAAYHGDAVASSGSLNYAAPTLDWGGELAIGDTVTINYSVTVDASSGGDLNLVNTVGSASMGSTCVWPAEVPAPPCTTSTAVDSSTVGLRDLTETVELAGPADATVTRNGAVTMTIDSNSPSGYTVTVEGEADQLVSADSAITATIPLSELQFRETGTSRFKALTTDPQMVHDRYAATAPDGDAVSSDYQMHLPYADPGSYTVTLEYLVAAQ